MVLKLSSCGLQKKILKYQSVVSRALNEQVIHQIRKTFGKMFLVIIDICHGIHDLDFKVLTSSTFLISCSLQAAKVCFSNSLISCTLL